MTLTNLKLNYLSAALLCVFLLYMAGCHKITATHDSNFENEPTVHDLDPQTVNEASGIADSRINQNYLWVEEDSGNPNRLYLVAHDGNVYKSVFLHGITNRDWEDITLAKGPDPALDYLYLGDIGDNGLRHTEYMIYRFPEPSLTVDTVRQISTIKFKYPDGSHDAEALIVDDLYKEIYIITKRDTASRVYKLNAGYTTTGTNMLEFVASLNFNIVTSASISADRKDLLVKTYSDIYHYPVPEGESLAKVLKQQPSRITYKAEPQGEAISFATDNSGFFTLSEKSYASTVQLFKYKRK